MKKHKKIILSSIVLAATTSLVALSSVTFASYIGVKSISQATGYLGEFNQDSIFLNANIWEQDDPVYYMYRFNEYTDDNVGDNGEYVAPSKVITPTINGITFKLHVFEYDKSLGYGNNLYNQYLFFRLDRVVSGAGYATTPSDTYEIYVEDTERSIELFADERDSNHFVARHVNFAAGESYYIREKADHDHTYYNNTDGSYGVDAQGNYTVHFYVSATNNVHIVMVSESSYSNFIWNQTRDIIYDPDKNYWSIDGWKGGDYANNSYVTSNHLILDSNDNLIFEPKP